MIHVHADPDAENLLDIIIIAACKIPFLLRRNEPAHIEYRPVQDTISLRLVLLCLDIHNDLCQTISSPHVKNNIKSGESFIDFSTLSIQTYNPLPVFISLFCICQSRLNRNNTDMWLTLDVLLSLFRLHPLELINRMYKDVSEYTFL